MKPKKVSDKLDSRQKKYLKKKFGINHPALKVQGLNSD